MTALWLCLSFPLLLAAAGSPAGVTSGASVQWLGPQRHDFGVLTAGSPASHLFLFKNTGDSPLQVETARSTCGCTATGWPEEPVLPGQSAAVRVEYDAAKPGRFQKKVTVFFYQSRQPERLWVEGFVR